MAAKNKGGEIEFDLDADDLDWPDFNFDEAFEEPKDDRNPVTKIASTSLKAAGKTVVDPTRIRKTLTKTMPGAYSDAVGVGFDAASELKGVFDVGLDELNKTKTEVQRSMRRALPKVKGKLPDKLGKVLEKLAGTDYDASPSRSKEEIRNEGIQNQLDEILGAQNQQRVADAEDREARRLTSEAAGRKRFKTQMAAFGSMDTTLRQIRDYNEGIDARWKRKTLELQLQQNFLLNDLVENLGRSQADTLSRLDAIAKNTGLPEAAKIVASEEFKRLNQARMLEQLGQGVYGGLGDYLSKTAKGIRERVTTTVADKLRDFRSGFRDAADMSSDMIQMQSELGDQGDSLGTILELGLGAVSDWGIDKYGDKIKSRVGQNTKFNSKQGFIRNALNNGARFLNEEAGKRNTRDGFLGTLQDIGRSLLHTTRLDGSIRGADLTKGSMPDNFNRMTNISLIDIIPGLLSRIHHEVVKFRTGDENVPMIRYDVTTGTFTDSRSMIKRVKNLLVADGQDKYNNEGLDKIIDRIDPDKKLNGDQRKVLGRHLVQLNMTQRAFKIQDLVKGGQIHGPGAPKDKAALREFLAQQYGIDVDGSVKGPKDELHSHEADIGTMLNAMNRNFEDPTGPIKALIDAGYKDELLAAGILVNKNGSISINFDKVTDLRLGTGTLGEEYGQQAYSPSARRRRGGKNNDGLVNSLKDMLETSIAENRKRNQITPLPAPAFGALPGVKFDYAQMGKSVADALNEKSGPQDVLDKMDKIIIALEAMNDTYNSGYQTMVLEEIMDILTDGRQFTNAKITDDLFIVGGKQMGTEAGLWKDRAKRAGGRVRDAFGSAKRFIGGKVSAVQQRAQKLLTGARDKTAEVTRWLDDQRDKVVDVYIKGWSHPALEARKLEMGLYRDKLTGKIVKRLSDIKGEVEEILEDGSAKIVLSLEDIQRGLHDRLGRRVVLGGLKNIKDFAVKMGERIAGRVGLIRGGIMDKLTGAKDWVWDKLTGLHDVYVAGEDTPRLLKHILQAGGYFDKATGEVITKLSDIKGDIIDANGNLVLSLDDMRKGLVDQYGEAIKANWLTAVTRIQRAGTKLVGFGKKVLGKIKRMGKSALEGLRGGAKWAGGLVKGIGQRISNFFTEDGYSSDILKAQLEVQINILEQISQINPSNRKRKLGDRDGDGIVEGSWQDILRKREAKKEKEEAQKGKDGEEKKGGPLAKILASLTGGLGKLKSMFSKDEEDDGFGLSDAADVADIYDATKGDGDGRRRRRRRGGRLGRWGSKLKGLGGRLMGSRLVQGAGSLLASTGLRTAATTAVGWGARALMGAGAVAAGIISAPVALGIGIVAGVATLGWMAYKWYDSSKPRPLQKLRLAQYGFTGEDDDDAKKILGFEEKILKHTKIVNGKVEVQAGGEDAIEAIKDLGHDPNEPGTVGFRNFNDWYGRRFRPVFQAWMQALADANVTESLAKLDDACGPETKLTILKAVRNAGRSGWNVVSAPAEGMKMLTDEAKIEALADAAQAELQKEAPAKKEDKLAELAKPPADATVAGAAAAGAAAGASGGNDKGGKGGGGGRLLAAAAGGMGPGGALLAMGGLAMGTLAGRYKDTEKKPEDLYPRGALDALRTIRVRTYGLIGLKTHYVNAIIFLEWAASKKTKVDSNGDGYYDGTLEELIDQVAGRFGVSNEKDSPIYQNFKEWLDKRFLPTWTEYVGMVKAIASGVDPLTAHERLKPADMYKVAEGIASAGVVWKGNYTSVWSIPLHPIYGETPNTDSLTIADNMKSIIKSMEKDELDEIAGEKGKVKSGLFSKTKDFFTGVGDSVKNFFGIGSGGGTAPSSEGGWFSNMFGGGRPAGGTTTAANQTVGAGGPGGSWQMKNAAGVGVNFDPNGGKAGNVNDLPMPTSRKGFEAHRDLIAAVAKMTGVDAGILAGLMATESNFDSSVKNSKSSATGLGQFISSTWNEMVSKYGKLFGIKEGTSPNDPRANALMSVMYMKYNADIIKRTMGKTDLTDVDLYLAHFLGAGNYKKFMQNPGALAKDLDPAGARANPTIYYRGGKISQPVTAAEVLQIQGNKQVKNRNHYGPLMHSYLKARGEKVDESIFTAQGGVETVVTLQDKGQATPAPAGSDSSVPAPDAAAMAAGVAPAATESGEKPKESMARVARTANAGGADIASVPTASPEMAAGTEGLVKTSSSQSTQSNVPAPSNLPDPALQDQMRAVQASAQKETAANTTGAGMDKLVDIGGKQLKVQEQILGTLQTIAKLTAAGMQPGQAPRQPGPMSVKAPTSA